MTAENLAPYALEPDGANHHLAADTMAIRHGDQQLVLDLARGRVLN